ncbi:MAG TPA: aminotransferase class IV [Steroidobacteraceae bacterium]|nr:aminotransferase class IV [Steroidobacteraceae bacterium]
MAAPFPIAYLDGTFVPLQDARVSPLDRAFLYADSVYEVMPVYGGRVFRFREHFDRLDRSLGELRMRPVYSREQWAKICDGLIERNGGGDMYLYVQVTRGAEHGRNHAPLPDIERTVFAFASPLPPVTRERMEHGVAAVTAEDTRWSRCDIKSTALLANVMLKQLAVDANATETILLRDGMMMEGASTTVHVVVGGEIRTPPKSHSILPGTTRDVVSELATRERIPFRSTSVTNAQLRAADEIFIAAATIGTLAVTRLDDKPVGAGVPGPIWKRIHAAYESYKRELAATPAY